MESKKENKHGTSLLLPEDGKPTEIEHLLQFLLFKVEGNHYAIDILEIHEILKPVTLTRIPNVRSDVLGVINLRGNIIPVIDLRKKFFNKYTELGENSRVIVSSSKNKNIGLLVENISEVARINEDQLETTSMEDVSKQHIRGVGRFQDKVFLIINLAILYNQIGETSI